MTYIPNCQSKNLFRWL